MYNINIKINIGITKSIVRTYGNNICSIELTKRIKVLTLLRTVVDENVKQDTELDEKMWKQGNCLTHCQVFSYYLSRKFSG